MQSVTIREAKARLNELVEAARRGEQRLTDSQVERFWRQLAEDRRAGRTRVFRNPEAAVESLRAIGGRRRKLA